GDADMSDMFDDQPKPPSRPQQPASPGRSRALWITLGVVLALFLAFTLFASFWTERLWFKSTGYSSVFTQMVRTRIGLFLVFGTLMSAIVALNLYLAYR